MSVAIEADLKSYCLDVASRARRASAELARASTQRKNAWLQQAAQLLRQNESEIIAANDQDIQNSPNFGLTAAQVDRLRLNAKGIEAMASALEEIAALPDPVGEVIESSQRPNGLQVTKTRVPLGVIFFIYESRPNVTVDAAAICVKSGNAVILRGGKEAAHSNRALAGILATALEASDLPADAIQLVNTTDRAAVGHFLSLPKYVDLAIPRGGEGLIRRVAAEAKMPVLKHFNGNCHVYVDRAADLEMAEKILVNAKCQRMGVCNAAESLVVHSDVADKFLPQIAAALAEHGIEIRGDARTCQRISAAVPANDEDFATEYLGPIISVCVVDSLDLAIEHINQFSSQHTEAIVTADPGAAAEFTRRVDSSAVLVNASTRFNDGGQLGLGAEIGISTDKFHARGPCGLRELTTYKYVIQGTGQIRD